MPEHLVLLNSAISMVLIKKYILDYILAYEKPYYALCQY